MNDSTSSLTQLHKLIRSLRKQEIEQIQQVHGDALKQIATIAREHNLSIEHIQIAMSIRASRNERNQTSTKKFRKKRDGSEREIMPLVQVTE